MRPGLDRCHSAAPIWQRPTAQTRRALRRRARSARQPRIRAHWRAPGQIDSGLRRREAMYLTHIPRVNNMARAGAGMTETERIAHYRGLAAQFREWAKTEIN